MDIKKLKTLTNDQILRILTNWDEELALVCYGLGCSSCPMQGMLCDTCEYEAIYHIYLGELSRRGIDISCFDCYKSKKESKPFGHFYNSLDDKDDYTKGDMGWLIEEDDEEYYIDHNNNKYEWFF